MYLNRLYNKQSATCIIAMMKKMDFYLFKIFFILYLVDQSIEKNQTEQRNGKVYREYFFLEKMITILHRKILSFNMLTLDHSFIYSPTLNGLRDEFLERVIYLKILCSFFYNCHHITNGLNQKLAIFPISEGSIMEFV